MMHTGLLSLWHVASSDGFESLWIVGTLEECLALLSHPSMAGTYEAGTFELRGV